MLKLSNLLFWKKKAHHSSGESSLRFKSESPLQYYYIYQKNSSTTDSTNSDQQIKFGEINFGISHENVIKKKGKPAYHLKTDYYGHKLRTIIYKSRLQGRKRISIYYFIDDKFVIGEYVYVQPQLEDNETYRTALASKYLCDVGNLKSPFFIKDITNSVIYYEERSEIRIKYFSNIEKYYSEILFDLEQKNSKDVKSDAENLYKNAFDTF